MEKDDVQEIVKEVEKLEEEVVPPAPALPPPAVPEVAVAKIVFFLIAFYLSAVSIRFLILKGPGLLTLLKEFAHHAGPIPKNISILFDFFVYMCLACTFFPLPTIPPIAFTAKVFHPLLVTTAGAAGTCIANLNDYAILGLLFRHHRVKKIRDIQTYRRLLRFFDRYSFLTLSAASFLPIPIDVIRLLAISRAYSYWKYILATFTGRFPRYAIIAYLGRELPARYILVIFGISVLPALAKFLSDMIKKRKRV